MNIIAVDPGLTIGLARVDTYNADWDAWQTTDVHEAELWIDNRISWDDNNVLLIEDYISGGHLTKEAKTTLLSLGFFYWRYSKGAWYSVETPVPQKRKSRVGRATELGEARNVEGPHSWDALAHILAYMYRNNMSDPL